jgi:CHAT domain-containing protein/uncharacterized protein HemY
MRFRQRQNNWNVPVLSFILSARYYLILLLMPLSAPGFNSAEVISTRNTLQRERIGSVTTDRLVRQKIAPGSSHSYELELAAGQFLQFILETLDEHISVVLFNPDRRKVYDVNSRRFKPTSLSLIAEVSGVYTLELQSQEVDGDAASYELMIKPLRKASLSDRDFVAAERYFAAATKLREEWTKDALLKAISKYQEAYNYWHAIGDRQQQIEILTSIGEAYSRISQSQKALDHYNQALLLSRSIQDHRSEIDLLNDIGYINIDLDNRHLTLDYCNQALALGLRAGYVRGQAQALNNIGLAYHVLSDTQRALDSFDQALGLWKTAGDRRGQAQTLTNMGYSYNDRGDLRRALGIFNEALSLWEKSRDRQGETLTLTAIGLLYSSLGDMQKALDAHDKATQFFQKMGDKSGEAVTLNAMAYVYDTLGDKHRALNCYKKAAQLFRAAGRRSSEAVTLGLIGEVYDSLGDKQKALTFYKQNFEISKSLGNGRVEAYALKDIGDTFVHLGEKDKALDHYNRSLSLSRSASDPRGQAYALNSIGYVYEVSGQKQKALDHYKQAIALNRAAEDHSGEVQTLQNIARVARDLGDFKEAHHQIKAVLDIIETVRAKVASQELRASYFASAHQHYELYIDILMHMHKQDPAAGYAAAALEASEKARGRGLLDLLNEARVNIREGVDPVLLQRESTLQNLLNTKAEQQVHLPSGTHTDEQAEAMKKEVADLTNRYEEVLSQIRATSPRYATLTQPQTLSLPEIQQQLDEDTMLLEYSLGNDRSYLWAVTPTSATAYELPDRKEIEALAIRLYRSLTSYGEDQKSRSRRSPEEAQYARLSNELTSMLLEPIAAQLGRKRLVIVADGALQYIPCAALPEPNEDAGGVQGEQPLIVNHEIINLPSVSIFSALRSEIGGRDPAPRTLAVLADPVFEKDDPRVSSEGRSADREVNRASARLEASRSRLRSADANEKLHFQRLPFASREAIAITSLVPEQEHRLALGFDASLQTAKSAELQQYRIVHFATHGLIYGAHPQLYGVVLSLVDRQGNSQDGFLRLNEIYNLKLSADLVVLSACQTALGKDIKGEGLVGITRGFMYAGAGRVIASLWKVDDRASAELMQYFYEGLFGQPRLRPAAALRAAQIRMWKQRRWKAPYYWAAFTLQGEWK